MYCRKDRTIKKNRFEAELDKIEDLSWKLFFEKNEKSDFQKSTQIDLSYEKYMLNKNIEVRALYLEKYMFIYIYIFFFSIRKP